MAAQSLQATLQPVSWTTRAATIRHALMHLIRRLAEGGPLVRLTVPVSPGLRRFLKFWLIG